MPPVASHKQMGGSFPFGPRGMPATNAVTASAIRDMVGSTEQEGLLDGYRVQTQENEKNVEGRGRGSMTAA